MTGIQTGTLASSLPDNSLTVNAHIYEGILLDQWKASLQSLWSLLIIWTLFSLHATQNQKFIKLFFSFAALRSHLYSPLSVLIYLRGLPQRSTELCRGPASKIIKSKTVDSQLTRYSHQAAAANWCGSLSSWRGGRTGPWTWRLGRLWLCPHCWFGWWSHLWWPRTGRSALLGVRLHRC